MKKSIVAAHIFVIFMLSFVVCARAQNLDQETCDGPVYPARELSRRATIGPRQIPAMTQEALAHDVHGRVVIEAVLCHTGKVTDVLVIETLPDGMTEKAVEAVRGTKFKPAEIDGQPVSQKTRFEFHFNYRGVSDIAAKDAEGRLTEFVEIVGNRRFTAKEILRWIQTRPGEAFSQQQVTKDLAAILATGNFEPTDTRVQIEEAARGGVGIVFEVHELPLINEIKFAGLTVVSRSEIFEALRKDGIDLRPGGVYDVVKVRAARQVIRRLLALQGQPNAEVEVVTDQETSTALTLKFVVVETRRGRRPDDQDRRRPSAPRLGTPGVRQLVDQLLAGLASSAASQAS